MKKMIVLLCIAPILIAASAHKYYLSVTDISFNEEENSIQIITRLFYDDVEDVLKERYDSSIVVDATYDQEKLDGYLSKYLSQKLKLTVNAVEQKTTFVGKEFEDDYVVCYVEITNIEAVKSLEIENTLLTDLFPEQKNMVHTKINKKKKSFLLTRENAKGLLKF